MSHLMTKTNKMTVRQAKTQISLGICPVWSEPSLCTQWVAKDLSFLHADSDDWVFTGRTATLLVLSWSGSNMLSKLNFTGYGMIPPTQILLWNRILWPRLFQSFWAKLKMSPMLILFSPCSMYLKFLKYSDTQKMCCNHSKIWTMWLYYRIMSPNDADGMTQCRPWSDCSSRCSLIWVCTVSLGISVWKLRIITVLS